MFYRSLLASCSSKTSVLQMARLVLHDLGIEYVEELVGLGSAEWQAAKKAGLENGTIPFGQMPVFTTEDGQSIVQSLTIMRHLARKYKLYGADEKEAVLADMVTDEISDFRRSYSTLVYQQQCEASAVAAYKAGFTDRMGRGAYLAHIEAFAAAHGGPFLIGKSITYADYVLFDLLNTMLRLIPDLLTAFNTPTLAAWYERFAARPNLKKYIDSNPVHRQKANGNGLG